ncbi:MAG: succinate dehydrogenase, hydrophobic membrane anchor protein [Novosphingobium sp.]|nr:succinate dehydrogenase, hydrophobic membrane anchor protein [Novosphingobium sp.]
MTTKGTSIGRVRGLGSARHGARQWLLERFTGLASLFTSLYLLVSLVMLSDLQYATVREWIAQPLVATVLALFVIANFWHTRLGLQMVIEDYVHEGANKFATLALLNLAVFAGAAYGLLCILRLALGVA